MPYKISKTSKGYCVVKSDTGEERGCSDTRSDAVKHMAALYAAEGHQTKEVEELVFKSVADFTEQTGEVFSPDELDTKEWGMGDYYYPWSATTYAEVERQRDAIHKARAVSELLDMFPALARNAMDNPEVADKSKAIEALAGELSAKIAELSAEDNDTKEAAEPAESKIDKEEGFIKRVVDRVLTAIKSIGTPVQPEENSMMLWKDESGQYRWLARYSNNFIDDDNPPDIVSEKSHRRFVEMVDAGTYPYPVIELWHEKSLEFGRADWVAYDDSGFALASGYVYPGCEGIAESLSKLKNIGMSHGMPVTSIVRDPSDPRVIVEHQTVEVSALPLWAAANKRTSFQVFKEASTEDDMGLPIDKKMTALKDWGINPDILDRLENINQKDAADASAAGIEHKDADGALPSDPPVNDAAASTPAEGDTTAKDKEGEPTEAEQPTVKEIAEAFAEVVGPMVDVVKALEAKVADLTKEVESVKTARVDAEKAAADEAERKQKAVAAVSPIAALMAGFADSRAVGNADTQVKDNDPLAELKPKELNTTGGITGIQFLDVMLNGK